jgi:hypothetical protein
MIALMPSRRNDHRFAHVALGCALGASLGVLGYFLMRDRRFRWSRGADRHTDEMRDKTLKDTYPASDPPASQFFDIPANRI